MARRLDLPSEEDGEGIPRGEPHWQGLRAEDELKEPASVKPELGEADGNPPRANPQ
jgi:hypothetical protein